MTSNDPAMVDTLDLKVRVWISSNTRDAYLEEQSIIGNFTLSVGAAQIIADLIGHQMSDVRSPWITVTVMSEPNICEAVRRVIAQAEAEAQQRPTQWQQKILDSLTKQSPIIKMQSTMPRRSGKQQHYYNVTSSNSTGWSTSSNTTVFDDIMSKRGPQMIGLDFETYCELDIKKVGLDRYINHPSFRVLIASIAMDDLTQITYDFVRDYDEALGKLRRALKTRTIAAHNAGFERAVLRRIGLDEDALFLHWVDTAEQARAQGFGASLEAAAAQTGVDTKLDVGSRLIKKFCTGDKPPTWLEVENDPDWSLFMDYCERDARAALRLADHFEYTELNHEHAYSEITHRMNQTGWAVDLPAVREMQSRYEDNKQEALELFRGMYDPEGELNLQSPIQLVKWCRDRGVNARSFDEAHVESMLTRINKKLEDPDLKPELRSNYLEVQALLETKRTIGGSSLKKLQVILNMTGSDGRLRNQYMHIGAGQSYRTSGKGVQMQNLKRITVKRDMAELYDPASEWSNDDLAANLRQVFYAPDPEGSLIVGDFSAVEARGLAYLAGEEDTLNAFRQGKDLYKVQAAKRFGVAYEDVDSEQRRFGKVGVLSCGYQAGAGAVRSFASGMGVELTEAEAADVVRGWRNSNPKIVEMWGVLDELLHEALRTGRADRRLAYGLFVRATEIHTPTSLKNIHPGAKSIEVSLQSPEGGTILKRVFHGCYLKGRAICYYKPSFVRGTYWSKEFRDPKTGNRLNYSIYGGKLAGILTQSFCRELFFRILVKLQAYCDKTPGLLLIGQFHDEAVLQYTPVKGGPTLERVMERVTEIMQDPGDLIDFPLAAEVKADYRYTK